MGMLGKTCQGLQPRRRGSLLIIITWEFIYCNQPWWTHILHIFCSGLYKKVASIQKQDYNTINKTFGADRQSDRQESYKEETMRKVLAIFLVVSIVIAVTNLPTVHGIAAGGTTWKRALEVV